MVTKIVNGTVIDGTGAPGRREDVAFRDDLLIDPAEIQPGEPVNLLDATGMVVTPGFIDIHRHCDLAALYDPAFGELELAQGITTVVAGNCGLSAFPLEKDARRWLDYIEPVLGAAPKDMKISSFEQYMDALGRQRLRVNMGMLVGTGAATTAAKGMDDVPFTKESMAHAQALIRRAMRSGAFGISTGIMYTPESYSSSGDFVELARAAAEMDGVMTCHIRVEGDGLVKAVDEAIAVAEATGIRLNISHFKATGVRNWKSTIYRAMARVQEARDRGVDVCVDFYPYTAGSTTLKSLLPNGSDLWDDMSQSLGWERIDISSVTLEKNRRFVGHSIAECMEMAGTADGWQFIRDLVDEEQGKVAIISNSMCEDDVKAISQLPYSMLISDALYGGGRPHPRLYGSFPRFLRNFCMRDQLMNVETAVAKMTSMPASRLKLDRRGVLMPGNFADVCVFDLKQIRDRATFAEPCQLSTGIAHVFVNGKQAAQSGVLLKKQEG